MIGLGSSTRQAVRSVGRSPGFALAVVALLGLGVGSVSAIWAIVDHVLLRPLPYPAVERLFEVQNGSHSGLAFEEFHRIRSADAWAAVSTREARLTGEGEPLRVVVAEVSSQFFALLGARPAEGRLLVAEDHRGSDVAVLSHGTWQRVWGGDPSVIGRTIRIDGRPLVVVGVLDPAFVPPEALMNPHADVWRPIDFASPDLKRHDARLLSVVGRLASGASLADAQLEASRIAQDRARAFPEHYRMRDGRAAELPVVALQEATVGAVRRGLGLLLGAVGLLLLVACANVTHLFLARAVERVREMSVRRALGARTGALALQLFMESLLLGLAGAAAGVGIAASAVRGFKLVNPGGLPRVDAIAIDVRVAGFAAAVGVVTAVLFGLIPALRIGGGSAGDALRSSGRSIAGSRGAQAVRSGIVIAEVALSLVLIAQAGWLLRSFVRLHEEPLGFRTEGVLTLPLTPTEIRSAEAYLQRMEAVRASLAAVPGVRAATFGFTMPLEWTGGSRCCWSTRLSFSGEEGPIQMIHPVEAGYFQVLGLEVLAGRPWAKEEASASPRPAVATEALAVAQFGSAAAAIGRTFELDDKPFRIVAVVADNRHYGPDQDHGPAIYVPIDVIPFTPSRANMAVLVDRAAADLPARLREAVWRVEPELPVPTVRPMAEWAAAATSRARFQSALLSTFAVVALLLVAAGLSGTLLYMVRLQRKDLGIRLALGETAGRVQRRFLRRGFLLAAAGSLLGGAGAWASGRLIESRLFGVETRDFRTLASAAAVLLFSALLASWLPARRAAATDPLESLRAE